MSYIPRSSLMFPIALSNMCLSNQIAKARGEYGSPRSKKYDLEIKPTKLVKGQGLSKLLTEQNCEAMGVSLEASISDQPAEEVIPNGDILDPLSELSESDWYRDILHYLQHLQFPDRMDRSQARSLRLKAMEYYILDGRLYWKDPGGILLTCITEEKTGEIIDEFHRGIFGGHQAWRATAYKILRVGYYWPTHF